MQADVQVAIDRMLASSVKFFGIHEEYRDTLNFAHLLRDVRHSLSFAPPKYIDVDVGEATTVKCLSNGLWLCYHDQLPYAVLLARFREYSPEPLLRVEIAVKAGPAGESFAERCFAELEAAVRAARSYRGKILSFDSEDDYRGTSTGIMVHRLPAVQREQVILSEQTLKLLDRNVMQFVGSREALRQLEAERWVVYYQNRGAFVAAVTASDIRNLYGVRRILEMGSVAAVAHHVDEPTLREARALDAEMRRAPELSAIVSAHNRFHELLYGSIGNPRLVEAIAAHRVTVRRLADPRPRVAAIVKMTRPLHRALLKAFAERDVRAAQRATDAELAELQAIMLAGVAEASA